MNKEINKYFSDKKKKRVSGFVMGRKPDLWRAVKAAKDINQEGIPCNIVMKCLYNETIENCKIFGSRHEPEPYEAPKVLWVFS